MIEARRSSGISKIGGGWSRRRFASSLAAGIGTLYLGAGTGAATPALPLDRHFAIFRDGEEIGRHDVRFTATESGLEVSTDIDITVKVAFLTAFRYEQHARDQWTDGLLVESRVSTNDNGARSETSLRARGNDLDVEGGIENRVLRVPLGTMTDIAFWNLAIVRQRVLVDLQLAELTSLAARPTGTEEVEVAGARIAAERYTVDAQSGRNGDIWYDAAGNWVKGVMVARGEKLEYRLLA